MIFQNLQEMYLIIYAWKFYELMWEFILSTGLILIPFIGIMIEHTISEYKKRGLSSVAENSLRRVGIDYTAATLVMLMVYHPLVSLNTSNIDIRLIGSVNEDVRDEVENDVRTEIQNLSGGGTIVKVPVLMALIDRFFTGWVYELNDDVANMGDNVDLRQLESMIYSASVDDPVLFAEIRNFTNDCYRPARSKYNRLYSTNPTDEMRAVLEDYPEDLNWIGSILLNRIGGLYAKCPSGETCGDGSAGLQSKRPLERFDYDEDRDSLFGSNGAHPYCSEWWGEEDIGLRASLMTYIEEEKVCEILYSCGPLYGADFIESYKLSAAKALSFGPIEGLTSSAVRKLEDSALRHFLRNTASAVIPPSPYMMADGTVDETTQSVQNAVTFVGALFNQTGTQGKMNAVKISLPIIQSVLMMILIIILPLYGLMSGFEPKKVIMIVGTVAFIKLLTLYWQFVTLIDNVVLEKAGIAGVWANAFNTTNTTLEGDVYIQMFNLIIVTLYVGLPIIGGAFLAAASSNFSMQGLSGQSMSHGGTQQAEQAGSKGDSVAKSAASKGGKSIGKK